MNHLKPRQISSASFKIKKSKIDIWQYPLHFLPPKAIELIDKDEKERAHRFVFEKHRRRFIASHAGMRLILARYLEMQPPEIFFQKQQHGKPYIQNKLNIEFNLSHSGETALLAVGQQLPMGVDIESYSERSFDGLACQVFSKTEVKIFAGLSAALKPLAFFNIWSQKEAFIKASGLGLKYPTHEFSVPILTENNSIIFDNRHQKLWQMFSFMPQIACWAALCCDPSIHEVEYFRIDNLKELFPYA